MRLLRLATIYIDPADEEWEKFTGTFGDVGFGTIGAWTVKGRTRMLVAAEVALDALPEVTGDDEVVVPEEKRREAETALESAANLIAVSTGGHRSISSPMPHVAFRAESETEQAWLTSKAGFAESGERQAVTGSAFRIDLDEDAINALRDRLDGVALLAEALAHKHATGQFHELVRLFERAFARASNRLLDPLANFLAKADPDYARDEVENWVVGLRHPATHADVAAEFATEADIRPVVSRMTMAAYEVLFNKNTWRSPASGRREVWKPSAGSSAPDSNDIFLTKGRAAKLRFQLLDQFGAYPLDLSAGLPSLSDDCWPRTFGEPREEGRVTTVPSGIAEIREEPG
jgi:hypothetical protein